MNVHELAKEPLVLDWFTNIEAAKFTRRNFLQGMCFYTEFVKKTPSELLDEAETEIKSGILMRKRKIKEYLLNFREWLKGRGYAPKTVHNHMTAILSFYRSFDIDLPQLNHKKQFKVQATEENSHTLKKESIQEALKFADVRSRAIILGHCSSGLSQSDLLDLTVEDFKKGLDEKTMITTLEIRRNKTEVDHFTFLSPEATKAVLDYLEYRNRKPKHPRNRSYIIAWEKRRVRSDKDYLFCSAYIPESYLKTLDENERRLTGQGSMDMFRELSRKIGLDNDKKGQWHILRTHNFRKHFYSSLLNNGAGIFFAKFLMGHTIDPVHKAYFKADPKKLRDKYIKYLPFLALTDTETYVIESEEYTKLKAENEKLMGKVAELEKDRSEVIELKEKFAKFESELNELFDEDVIQALIKKKKTRGIN